MARPRRLAHADTKHKGEHQRSHDAKDRFDFDGKKRIKGIAFQHITGDRLDQGGQRYTADKKR